MNDILIRFGKIILYWALLDAYAKFNSNNMRSWSYWLSLVIGVLAFNVAIWYVR